MASKKSKPKTKAKAANGKLKKSLPAKKNGHALSFHGWRRENGRVGIRNHVVILPLDDLSNAACEAVSVVCAVR